MPFEFETTASRSPSRRQGLQGAGRLREAHRPQPEGRMDGPKVLHQGRAALAPGDPELLEDVAHVAR